MTPQDIDRAAEILRQARRRNAPIDCIPEEVRPRNLQEAYAVQKRLAEMLGGNLAGWYCACTSPGIQRLLALDEPYYARLFADCVFAEPATLNLDEYPPMVLECEVGFRLRRDLPRRNEPYRRAEVEDAIATVHPTIEAVAGHLKDWTTQDVWSVIADNGTDGALVYGAGVAYRNDLNLVDMRVTLRVNGRIEREGQGRNALGDPVTAFVWLANARARDGEGLKAGHIHNTGTTTDIYRVRPGDRARAEFEGLGPVHLELSSANPRTETR